MAGLSIAFGALAAGEVVTIGYLERRTELAALRALGWPMRSVLRLLTAQAVGIGLLGGVLSAVVVLAGARLAGEPLSAALEGSLVGLLVAPIATLLTALGPLALAARSQPVNELRGE
jgi:putative ABC transport system permease protein